MCTQETKTFCLATGETTKRREERDGLEDRQTPDHLELAGQVIKTKLEYGKSPQGFKQKSDMMVI